MSASASHMGTPLARRLLLQHAVHVYDRDRAAIATMVAAGAKACEDPADLAARCAGTIAILVGATSEQYDRLAPFLRTISVNVFHAGGVGAGQVLKLANNVVSAACCWLSMEAVALATKNGIEPTRAVDIMVAATGQNFFMENFMKSHIIADRKAVGYTLALVTKDLMLACNMGQSSDVTMLFGNLTRELFQMVSNETGLDAPINVVADVIARLSGTEIVAT